MVVAGRLLSVPGRLAVVGFPLVSRTNLGANGVDTGVARLLPSKITDREEATGDGSTDDEATGDGTAGDGSTTRRLNLRSALFGVGALAGGYVVGRRLLGGGTPSAGGLRERAGEALPGDGVDVPIVGKGGSGDDDTSDEASSAEREGETGGGDEPAPGADPSLEEIDERTGSDVKEEPAEPGEMQVDEDVLEEAVDDEDETEE